MALEDHKIGEWTSPVSAEADRPQRSAAEMKAVFDSNSEDLKRALNALIDELSAGSGGDGISMSALDDITAGTLRSMLGAIYAEAKEGVRSEDILAIRLGNVGQLEVTLDGETWLPIAGGGGGGGDWPDIAALPVAEDIQPPDGFLMYDASLSLPRRALWDKLRSKLAEVLMSKNDYAAEDPATVKRAAAAVKLETPRRIGEAEFDGTEDLTLGAIGAQPASLLLQNVLVAASSWTDDTTYADYPYRAMVAITGVTADMAAEVVFALEEAISGNFAPINETYAGGLYLYAAAMPEADVTIPRILVWR